MTFILLLTALYGGLIVPGVLLTLLRLERRTAAKRIAMLNDGSLYVERLRAIHLIERRHTPDSRDFNRRDLRSAPAIFALWLPIALAVASPFVSGASEAALLMSATCGVWWWRKLDSAAVVSAWFYPFAAWTLSATIWLAVMTVSSVANIPARLAPGGVDPLNLQLWDGVFADPTIPILAATWGLTGLAVATVALVEKRGSRIPAAIAVVTWAPMAVVVCTGSFLGAHQFALAVGFIGYAMSRSKRQQRDYATELIAIGSDTGASAFAPRIPLPRAAVYAALVATVATFTVAAVDIGSWTIASTNSLSFFSPDNPWPWFIYIQVWLVACPGVVLLAWSVVNHSLDRYGAMALGFIWPLVLAFLLDMHADRGPGWLWQYQDWLLVPAFAAGMVTSMWVVTYGIRAKLVRAPEVHGSGWVS